MVQIWRPWDNFCAFEALSKMADLKFIFALMKKRQCFCYPTVESNLDNVTLDNTTSSIMLHDFVRPKFLV
jgi:hypothetical protein